MGLGDNKMTKQGVRDLNHPIPKKQPVENVPQRPAADASPVVAPVAAVPETAVVLPVEP